MATAAVLGLIYNGVMLLEKGPDEPRHMDYVRLLLDERIFPYLEAGGGEHAGAHTLHPPLYYGLLVPVYALFRGLPGEMEWHVVRVVSLLLCLASLPLWYQIALRASGAGPTGVASGANVEEGKSGGDNRIVACLAVAHLALLPIFGMTAGTVNNDSSSLLAVAAFLWLLAVKYPGEQSLRSAVVIGLCFGLGGLCKATVLLCDGIALAVYLLAQSGWVGLRSPRLWGRLAVVGLCVLAVAGPWYGRNIALYGQFAGPIAHGYSLSDLNWLPAREQGALVMMLHPNFPELFGRANWSMFYSLWSQKDWIPGAWRTPVYLSLATYCGLAFAGFAAPRMRRSPKSESIRETAAPDAANEKAQVALVAGRIARGSSYSAFIINWLACLVIALFVHWGWHEGGRYMLPSLGGPAIFLARGWRELVGAARLRLLLLVWCAALLALNAIAIYWLLIYLNPKFGPGSATP